MKKLSILLFLLLLATGWAHAQEKINGSSTNQAAVSKIVADSLATIAKNVTIIGGTVSTTGTSTTITLPSGGGSSVTVDNALDGTSTNPPSNAAVTAAISSATANIASNTSGLSSANSSISSQGARITTLEGNVSANSTNIAANSANITALTSASATNAANIAANASAIASLSALLGQLQQQVAGITGTFTIQAPTLTVSSITNTGAVISWGASTSATSYTLESATNSGFTTGVTTLTITSGTTFTLTALTAGTTYYLRIRASGGAGTTASGYGTANFTTTNTLPTLSAPTGIAATATSASAITVSWTASSNATSYTVRYSTSASMSSPTSTTTASTSVSITGLTAATAYYFDVSASASGYNTSATSSTATATTQATFTIAQTIRVALQTSSVSSTISTGVSTSAIVQNVTYNRATPTPTSLTTASGYSLGNLVNDVGGATSISVAIGSGFSAGTASSVASASLVNGMIYPWEVMQRAWQVTTANSSGGSLVFTGLNPNRYYQVVAYGVTSTPNVVTKYTVTGATSSNIQKTTSTIYGIGGGSELTNSAPFNFKNVQSDSGGTLTILVNAVSGSASPINTVALVESVNPMP